MSNTAFISKWLFPMCCDWWWKCVKCKMCDEWGDKKTCWGGIHLLRCGGEGYLKIFGNVDDLFCPFLVSVFWNYLSNNCNFIRSLKWILNERQNTKSVHVVCEDESPFLERGPDILFSEMNCYKWSTEAQLKLAHDYSDNRENCSLSVKSLFA